MTFGWFSLGPVYINITIAISPLLSYLAYIYKCTIIVVSCRRGRRTPLFRIAFWSRRSSIDQRFLLSVNVFAVAPETYLYKRRSFVFLSYHVPILRQTKKESIVTDSPTLFNAKDDDVSAGPLSFKFTFLYSISKKCAFWFWKIKAKWSNEEK